MTARAATLAFPGPVEAAGLALRRVAELAMIAEVGLGTLLVLAAAERRSSLTSAHQGHFARWFAGPLAGWLEAQLLGPAAQTRALFDPAWVRATLAAHTSGSADRSRDLWMLLNTHLWWGLFVEDAAGQKAAASGLLAQRA